VDGKSTWDKLQIAADDETFQRLAFPTRDTGFAASAKGVYRTDDAGQNWKRAWASELSNVYALAFADPDHGWLGADRLYRTDDGGTQWNAVVLPGDVADVRAISVGPGGRGLAAGTGKNGEPILFRLRSGGWALVDPAAWDGPTRPHRTWTVASVAAAGDRDAWAVLYTLAGGGSGVVLHTADGADHWQTSEPFDVSLHHIHFADARRGWLAGFHGKLWTTEDGGGHWTPQANPDPDEVAVSCLAFARSGQAWALAPLLDGRVLLSADGRSWQAVQVELTGLTPDAAVVDPGRAYVLARDGGVARYTDPRFRPKP
jgi:photosystem II stability/assembly factor-like uncharacterized protein